MKVEKKLKFTFLITDRSLSSKIAKGLKKLDIERSFTFYGKGSAPSAILDYLGIGESEKSVLVYPTSEDDSSKIIEYIKNSEFLKRTIVFVVPVQGISSNKSLKYFLKEEVK